MFLRPDDRPLLIPRLELPKPAILRIPKEVDRYDIDQILRQLEWDESRTRAEKLRDLVAMLPGWMPIVSGGTWVDREFLYTANDTWVLPGNPIQGPGGGAAGQVFGQLLGGGSGGVTASGNGNGGAGGAGGGSTQLLVTPTGDQAVTIGAGSATAIAASLLAGGNTTFGSLITANGGAKAANQTSAGAGGAAGTGGFKGGNGGNGAGSGGSPSGGGGGGGAGWTGAGTNGVAGGSTPGAGSAGNSPGGTGGSGGQGDAASGAGSPGTAASNYGAGGGGGGRQTAAGTAGTGGYMRVTYQELIS